MTKKKNVDVIVDTTLLDIMNDSKIKKTILTSKEVVELYKDDDRF